MEGWVDLGDFVTYQDGLPTHPSTNRAKCRLTMFIEANMLTTTLRCHSAMSTNLFLSCLYMQLAYEAKIIVQNTIYYNTASVTVRVTYLQNPVHKNISWSVVQRTVYIWRIYCRSRSRIVWSPNVSADDVSIHLLYRNSLDIHSKHMASHLHDEINVS